MGYVLGLGPVDSAVGALPGGTNLALIGPPMSHKSELAKVLMHGALGRGDGVVYITTRDTGEKLLAWFAAAGLDLGAYPDAFGIIDCVSSSVNLGDGSPSHPAIRLVNGPMDLAGISIEVTDLLNALLRRKDHPNVWVLFDSLSVTLMYSNLPTVFRFLHVLTSTVRKVDALSLVVLEEGVHDAQTRVTIEQLVQGVLEVRRDGDRLCLRAAGLPPGPTPWAHYTVAGGRVAFAEGGP